MTRQPSDEDIRRFDKGRNDKIVSNDEWVSETDPDARIAKLKDGRTHLAYKAEHVVDLDTNIIVTAETLAAPGSPVPIRKLAPRPCTTPATSPKRFRLARRGNSIGQYQTDEIHALVIAQDNIFAGIPVVRTRLPRRILISGKKSRTGSIFSVVSAFSLDALRPRLSLYFAFPTRDAERHSRAFPREAWERVTKT